jgi:hypothetical protein
MIRALPSDLLDKVGTAIEIWAAKRSLDTLLPLPKSTDIVSVPGCRLTLPRQPDIPAIVAM